MTTQIEYKSIDTGYFKTDILSCLYGNKFIAYGNGGRKYICFTFDECDMKVAIKHHLLLLLNAMAELYK